jgi:hypothetical protein
MITVLYCRRDSIYKTIPGLDCWDVDRNARMYQGPNAVIAHPPCATWSRMRAMSKGGWHEKSLSLQAVWAVRSFGGVLEHPASSSLWTFAGLPTPGSVPDPQGGFSISVDQHWWGHKARKSTWLYIVGINHLDIPAYPISLDAVTNRLGKSYRGKKEISKAGREQTPELFAKWLVDLAGRVRV